MLFRAFKHEAFNVVTAKDYLKNFPAIYWQTLETEKSLRDHAQLV
jgi:hypothetical protein